MRHISDFYPINAISRCSYILNDRTWRTTSLQCYYFFEFRTSPLPLKLLESEIWDIKDFSSLIFLMLGRVQASLTLLSLTRKIEFLMFVIFCRCHF